METKYTERQLTELFLDYIKRKIWIEIKPLDSWDSWIYKIYAEDCMGPFYLVISFTDEFKSYTDALTHAINYLKTEGI